MYPEKVHLIDKRHNEGLLQARLSGIEYVLTETDAQSITFVDSDDYLEKDAVRQLVAEYQMTGADVVAMQSKRILGPVKRRRKRSAEPTLITAPTLYDDYFVSCFGWHRLPINAWGKLYACDVFRRAEIRPVDVQLGEDLYITMCIFPHINAWATIPYYGYNYRVGGMTSNYNPRAWHDFKLMYLYKRDLARERKYDKAFRWMTIEMKNILISILVSRIEELKEDDAQLRKWLTDELADDNLWEDMHTLATSETNPIYTAIADKDIDAILSAAHAHVKKRRHRVLAKRILRKILQ